MHHECACSCEICAGCICIDDLLSTNTSLPLSLLSIWQLTYLPTYLSLFVYLFMFLSFSSCPFLYISKTLSENTYRHAAQDELFHFAASSVPCFTGFPTPNQDHLLQMKSIIAYYSCFIIFKRPWQGLPIRTRVKRPSHEGLGQLPMPAPEESNYRSIRYLPKTTTTIPDMEMHSCSGTLDP